MLLEGICPIGSTEDPEKVRQSILNIFPQSEIETRKDGVTFNTSDHSMFIDILREQQIRDTAVMLMEGRLKEDSTRFFLNKQAAFMGRVNFTDGDSTLGDIEVKVLEGGHELIEEIRPRPE
ncbi:MAG: hypothetical protein JXA22_10215 [Candidatus Thermoplasmatota archaeon]|nr:hypothetical protein [Candidatus Thermoplasmatota archaeon]